MTSAEDPLSRLNANLQRLGHPPVKWEVKATTTYQVVATLDERTMQLLRTNPYVYSTVENVIRKGKSSKDESKKAKRAVAQDISAAIEAIKPAKKRKGGQHTAEEDGIAVAGDGGGAADAGHIKVEEEDGTVAGAVKYEEGELEEEDTPQMHRRELLGAGLQQGTPMRRRRVESIKIEEDEPPTRRRGRPIFKTEEETPPTHSREYIGMRPVEGNEQIVRSGQAEKRKRSAKESEFESERARKNARRS